MKTSAHPRGFAVSVAWTLALLWLGSVVHATESSLACPDWPTCFGTMMPEMTGGVFWEHLHRLWAGGLILIFGASVWLARREARDRTLVFRAGLLGIGLLLVQSVLGGLTVLFRLPDAVSTSHLTLAFLFLALTTVLAVTTGKRWEAWRASASPRVRTGALTLGVLVLAQSVVGAWVRHTDAGMACPDVPLCLGRVVPPLESPMVAIHFTHRLLGLIVAGVAIALAIRIRPRERAPHVRFVALGLAAVAVAQVVLGFLSVYTRLGVVPVSLHTLLAASLVSLSAVLATVAWPLPGGPSRDAPVVVPGDGS